MTRLPQDQRAAVAIGKIAVAGHEQGTVCKRDFNQPRAFAVVEDDFIVLSGLLDAALRIALAEAEHHPKNLYDGMVTLLNLKIEIIEKIQQRLCDLDVVAHSELPRRINGNGNAAEELPQ